MFLSKFILIITDQIQSICVISEILIVLPILTTNDMLIIYNPIYNKSNYYFLKY